jgi:hypothetical protein
MAQQGRRLAVGKKEFAERRGKLLVIGYWMFGISIV